jgi:hypothetical protein
MTDAEYYDKKGVPGEIIEEDIAISLVLMTFFI